MSTDKPTDENIRAIGSMLQKLSWADRETRAKVQAYGVDVIPLNYYSNIPSIEEVDNSFEYKDGAPPYGTEIFEPYTIKKTLLQLMEYSAEFAPPVEGSESNPSTFFWKNGLFSYSDAMSFYSFVRLAKPASIVEIGSGFSTLVAIKGIEKNKFGTIHCVEPYPREFLKTEKRINLHTMKAQEITSKFLNGILKDDDILFIDSTHTVKTGGDCLHIYLRLLPQIKRNIYVHVHDVFLPFGMPKDWLVESQRFWTEQYLLYAFLIDNPKAQVLYGSNYSATFNADLLNQMMGGKYGSGGGSLWFRYNGALSHKTAV